MPDTAKSCANCSSKRKRQATNDSSSDSSSIRLGAMCTFELMRRICAFGAYSLSLERRQSKRGAAFGGESRAFRQRCHIFGGSTWKHGVAATQCWRARSDGADAPSMARDSGEYLVATARRVERINGGVALDLLFRHPSSTSRVRAQYLFKTESVV